jgi:hypothetical protein
MAGPTSARRGPEVLGCRAEADAGLVADLDAVILLIRLFGLAADGAD